MLGPLARIWFWWLAESTQHATDLSIQMEIWLNPWSEDGLLRTAECPFAQSVALLMLPRLQPVPERQHRSDEQYVLKPAAPPDSADGWTQG